jgi:hypothetical protein
MNRRVTRRSVVSLAAGLKAFTMSWLKVVPEMRSAVLAVDIMIASIAATQSPVTTGGRWVATSSGMTASPAPPARVGKSLVAATPRKTTTILQ